MTSLVAEVQLALAIAFDRPRSYVLAAGAAVAMMGLLVWSGDFMQYFPETGWELDAGLSDRMTILSVGVLFGLLVPLEVAAISKARHAARAAGASGLLGPVFGILSMSCCAPLLAPALLSFVGFSGSTLLNAPKGVTTDGSGNMLIADTNNCRIAEIPWSSGTYWGISGMTGGDLYDWVVLPDVSLHLVVVDVVGKVVSSSKDAMSVTHALRLLALDGCPMNHLCTEPL